MGLLRLFLVIAFVAASVATVARSQDDLAAAKLQYDVSRAKLIKPIRDLQTSYESQLEKLRDDVRASGSLEKTKSVDAEIKGFRDGSAPPVGDGFPDLRRLQRIYVNEITERHAKAHRDLPALVKAYKENLEALQIKLTQQDQLGEAEKVKVALSEIDETLGVTIPASAKIDISGRPTIPALVEATDPIKPFQKGESIFTNRDFVWATIPKEFQDWQISMQPGGSQAGTRFKVKTPGLVYAVIGPGSEEDFKKNGWRRVDNLRGGEGGKWEYLVMEKPLEPDDYAISGKGWFSTRVLIPPSSGPK